MGSLDGKVALVTGGARGQGRSHALTLAREGADIVLADLCDQVGTIDYPMSTPSDLEETVAAVEALDRRVVAQQVDVRSQEQLDAIVATAIAELGRIDILVANAGVWAQGRFWELTEEQWHDTVDIDLGGVWRSAKAVAPHMIERGSGAIVMISSANGLEAGYDYAHYTAAKHGVLGLMKSVAFELGAHNIRCNAVCPGLIDSPMNDWQGGWNLFAGKEGATREDRAFAAANWALLAKRNVLKKSSVSNAVLYLCSDLSEDVTGVSISVDAGHSVLPGFNHDPIR